MLIDRFVWLARMSLGDIWPVYILFAAVILAALTAGPAVTMRSLGLIALAHAGPFGMLVWGTMMFGKSPAGQAQLSWMELVQFGIVLVGLAVVVMVWRPARKRLPTWTALPFFVGVAIINLSTMFVTGMALANDWI